MLSLVDIRPRCARPGRSAAGDCLRLSHVNGESLYAIRIALESLAVRLTVRQLSEAELAEIKLAFLEWSAAVSQGDLAAWREYHRRFHFSLYAHAGTRLVEQLGDLWDHADRYRLLQWTHAGDQTQLARLPTATTRPFSKLPSTATRSCAPGAWPSTSPVPL